MKQHRDHGKLPVADIKGGLVIRKRAPFQQECLANRRLKRVLKVMVFHVDRLITGVSSLEHSAHIGEHAVEERKTFLAPKPFENGLHGFCNFIRLLGIDHMRLNHA